MELLHITNLLCVITPLEASSSLREKTALHAPLNLKAPLKAIEFK